MMTLATASTAVRGRMILTALGILAKLLPWRKTIAQIMPRTTVTPEEMPETLNHRGEGENIPIKLLKTLTSKARMTAIWRGYNPYHHLRGFFANVLVFSCQIG